MTCRDALYIAFRESRVLKRPQGLPSDNELEDGRIYLNQQVDMWAARGCWAWTTTFQEYPLAPNHQPTLIGPNLAPPDFAAAERPVKIVSAAVILTGGTEVAINVRDAQWWGAQNVKNTTSTLPTDLYYEPDVPNGKLYFWPVSTGANQVELESMVVLQQFQTLDSALIAPPAYLAALTLTLAEELVDIWGTDMPGNLARRALKARDAAQINNNLPRRISSADYGTACRGGGDFNYLTGQPPE